AYVGGVARSSEGLQRSRFSQESQLGVQTPVEAIAHNPILRGMIPRGGTTSGAAATRVSLMTHPREVGIGVPERTGIHIRRTRWPATTTLDRERYGGGQSGAVEGAQKGRDLRRMLPFEHP